nr:MAG TPA: hypothetical protein [Caudoviricetes sp.]DAT24819.1 MAG TPA: hypothetical protein [Caudoviricetes sp.]
MINGLYSLFISNGTNGTTNLYNIKNRGIREIRAYIYSP